MPIHVLHRRQTLAISREEAWRFFSDPRNLARITPPSLGFQIVTPDLPPRVYPGLMIQYRVRPLLGVPLTWLAEITHVAEGDYFIDEQRVGPYALWHHEHRFRELNPGQVELEDRVTYMLRGGRLAEPVHTIFVRKQLAGIFDYRTIAVEKWFPSKVETSDNRDLTAPGGRSA